MATDKVKSDPRIKTLFDVSRDKKTATFDTYVEFINTQLKDKPLSSLVSPVNPKNSIFSLTALLDESIMVPPDMDGVILKDMLRLYLTGVSIPRSSLVQDKYKPMIAVSESKYNSQQDTLFSALQKVYGVTDKVSENIESKIAHYNLVLEGNPIAKDNLDIKTEIKTPGYLTTLSIKDPSKWNLSSIKPINIEFDTGGKLITTEVKIS